MLFKVEIKNSQGAMLTLPLADISGGYSINNIDGLGPVKATLVSSSFAQLNGAQYHSSKREPRNIVMTLGFHPDYTMSSMRKLRNDLYSFLMPTTEVNLCFYDDEGLTVDIMGRVETHEPNIFSKEPAVDISIMNFEPDFLDLSPSTVSGLTVIDTTNTLIPYGGSVEAGLTLTLNIDRVLSEFSIYLIAADSSFQSMDIAAAFVADDVLTINTTPGNKFISLNRIGTISSPLYAVSPQSNWPLLKPGDNFIRIQAVGAAIPYDVTYTNRYGGL